MLTVRVVAVFIFSTLLTGCSFVNLFGAEGKQLIEDVQLVKQKLIGNKKDNPCFLGAYQTEQCYYVVTITKVSDSNDGLIRGKVAKKACRQNKKAGNPFEDCEAGFNPREYFFQVKDSPHLEQGSDYEFDSQVTQPPSNVLVCRRSCKALTDELPVP